MMSIRNPKDFWSGVLFVALGVARDRHRLEIHARHGGADGSRLFPAHPRHPADRARRASSRSARCASQGAADAAVRSGGRTLIVLGSVVLFGAIVRTVGVALSTVSADRRRERREPRFRPRNR